MVGFRGAYTNCMCTCCSINKKLNQGHVSYTHEKECNGCCFFWKFNFIIWNEMNKLVWTKGTTYYFQENKNLLFQLLFLVHKCPCASLRNAGVLVACLSFILLRVALSPEWFAPTYPILPKNALLWIHCTQDCNMQYYINII